MENQRLVEEVRAALERYRRTLSPGIYLFAAEASEGSASEQIIEKRSDYTDPAHAQEFGVTFGFWPKGFAPAELPLGKWFLSHPFLQSVKDLDQAPATFLEGLKRHVEARTKEGAA
jgi:hypothetical protein